MYYLYSENLKDYFLTLEVFDEKTIKEAIINQLITDKTDMILQEKDYEGIKKKKYYGKKIIDIFEINPKSGEPSKVITKGAKNYYISLVK